MQKQNDFATIEYVDKTHEIVLKGAEKFSDIAYKYSTEYTKSITNVIVGIQTLINIGLIIWLIILTM